MSSINGPTAISFAGNSMQNPPNIITSEMPDIENIPTKDAKLYALAHASKSVIPFTSYPNKMITVNGYLTASGNVALDGLLDTFRGYFTGTDQDLDIAYYNSTRRYTATVNALSIDRPGGLSRADFTVQFMTTDPFGRDTFSGMLLTALGRTLNTYSDTIAVGGNAPWQWPKILLNYTSVSGGVSAVTIGNAATGQQIAIQRQWSKGDNLLIDVKDKTVTVNNTPVTFSGAFPEFQPGSNLMTYADNLGTRSFGIAVSQFRRFL